MVDPTYHSEIWTVGEPPTPPGATTYHLPTTQLFPQNLTHTPYVDISVLPQPEVTYIPLHEDPLPLPYEPTYTPYVDISVLPQLEVTYIP